MVHVMGLAFKESLVIKKIPYTVHTWLSSEIEKKVGKHAWYEAPVAIMPQLLHPISPISFSFLFLDRKYIILLYCNAGFLNRCVFFIGQI